MFVIEDEKTFGQKFFEAVAAEFISECRLEGIFIHLDPSTKHDARWFLNNKEEMKDVD